MKRIALLIPSLSSGGAERVMSVLANYLSNDSNLEIHLILYLKDEKFYDINENIIVHNPNFNYKNFSTLISNFKTISFLRKNLKNIISLDLQELQYLQKIEALEKFLVTT